MTNFTEQYNTVLSAAEEKAFTKWAKANQREFDVEDYDLRGAWKELNSGQMTEAENGHLGDKYKKPNHPTFSDQSVYHGADGYYGGSWNEGPNDTVSFTAGDTQRKLWSPKELQRYFTEREPNVQLVIPQPPSLSTGPIKTK